MQAFFFDWGLNPKPRRCAPSLARLILFSTQLLAKSAKGHSL
jgi:hypothetical protein